MKELEVLLNNLIKKGWKPWGLEWAKCLGIHGKTIYFYNQEIGKHVKISFRMRELVTIDSWLWQFVCKNKLLSDKVDMQDYLEDSFWFRRCPFDTNWMYRIMQSALYSEEDLPQFLIENIKVG